MIDPYSDDLDWIAEFDEGEAITPPDGGDAANSMLRWLARTEAEIAEIDETFDREILKLQARREDLTAGAHARVEKLRAALTDFGLRMRELGATKTALPHGTVSTRKGSASIDVTDADALLMWDQLAFAHEEATRPVVAVQPPTPDRRPSKQDIKLGISAGHIVVDDEGRLTVAATGERIPGVQQVTGDPSTKIETI